MTPPDVVRVEFTQQWLSKAQEDLMAARHLLAVNVPLLFAASFHAQQACEKFLKAFLVWSEIEFPKTHNIALLLELVENCDEKLALALDGAIILTKYGVDVRYPGNIPDLSMDEVKQAISFAELSQAKVLGAIKQAGFPV